MRVRRSAAILGQNTGSTGLVHLGFHSVDWSRFSAEPGTAQSMKCRMMRTSGSAIIRYFAPKSPSFMSLGACRLTFDRKRVALLPALLLVVASFSLVSCGSGGPKIAAPPSGVTTRVLASQSAASPTAFPGLIIVDGAIDTLVRANEINAGISPGLMAISPDRTTVIAFDSATNNAQVIGTPRENRIGSHTAGWTDHQHGRPGHGFWLRGGAIGLI